MLGVVICLGELSLCSTHSHSLFRGRNAGGAGAQHHSNAEGAKRVDSFLNLFLDLQIRGERKGVVPATVLVPLLRKFRKWNRDLAHKWDFVVHQFQSLHQLWWSFRQQIFHDLCVTSTKCGDHAQRRNPAGSVHHGFGLICKG